MSAAMTAPAITVRKDNPLCGDDIELTLTLSDGRIASASHRARACSLVRTSARMLGTSAPGLSRGDALALAESLDRALRSRGPLPDGFDAIAPVLLMPARRACVLLPWRALVDALALDGSAPGVTFA